MYFTTDLIRIAAAGGGLRIDASKFITTDLIRIAAAASNQRSILILENTGNILTSDKIRIAAAGKGSVIFNLTD